jgi:hypothetical protein
MGEKVQILIDFSPLTPRLSQFHTSRADFVPLQTVNLALKPG